MKRHILKLCLCFAFMLAAAACAEENETIEINEANFPDQIFRNYVQESADRNNDGLLSASERINVRTVNVTGMGVRSLEGIHAVL